MDHEELALDLAGNRAEPLLEHSARPVVGRILHPIMTALDKALQTMEEGDTTLDLSGNELDEAAGVALAKALEKNNTLTTLDLSGNELDEAAGVALAKELEKNNTLTTLDLWNNELDEAAGVALAKALEKNNTLTTLDLSDNRLGEAGGVALAKALEKNNTLTKLDLMNNRHGEAGGGALSEALEKNDAPIKLYLWNNRLGEAGGVALAKIDKLIERNKALQRLYHVVSIATSFGQKPSIVSRHLDEQVTGAIDPMFLKRILDGAETRIAKRRKLDRDTASVVLMYAYA